MEDDRDKGHYREQRACAETGDPPSAPTCLTFDEKARARYQERDGQRAMDDRFDVALKAHRDGDDAECRGPYQ
jgi:hypothetical protein